MKLEKFFDAEWSWSDFEEHSKELAVIIANPMLPDCPIIYASEKFLEHSGYSLNDIVGRNCRFMQGPDSEPAAIDEFRKAIAESKIVNIRITNYRKDGSKFVNQVMMRPLQRPGDRQQLIVAVQRRVDTTAA
ncbi:MAG: PAS domain-containing protein [Rhizobiaceae bacterium]